MSAHLILLAAQAAALRAEAASSEAYRAAAYAHDDLVEARKALEQELDLQRCRALRLTSLLGCCAALVRGSLDPAPEWRDDELTRFCEPTLNHYGFSLVDHPTKRNYLTLARKEQA